MFVMKGTIVFFSWILLNQLTGSKGISGICAKDWNVTISNNLGALWTGEAPEGTEVQVNITATKPSNKDDCPGREGRTSFEDKEFPPLKKLCSNTAYNVAVNLICEGTVDITSTQEFVIWTPPEAPSNVKAESVTSSSFTVSWAPPPGDIFAYRVKVNETVHEVVSGTSLPLKGLKSNTLYSLKVSAKGQQWSDWSDAVFATTKPIAPSDVKAESVTSSSFTVSWAPPPGDIFVYRVKVNETVHEVVSGTSLPVTGLKSNTLYNIKVSSKGQQWSDWSDVVFVKTKPIDIPVLILKKDIVFNTSIVVRWDHPGEIVSLFSVRWIQEGGETYQFINTTTASCTIRDLVPYTFYHIEVCAWVEDRMGNWSDPLTIRTADGIPFLPRNLKEGRKTSRSVEVLWDEPTPSRGTILHYNIWCRAKKERRSLKYFQTNETHYLVGSLNPAQRYIISVKAVTVAGDGNWSDLTVKTLAETPHPPKNVSAMAESPNSIKVMWDTPGVYVGKIRMYTVLWKELESDNTYSANTTELSYVIKPLKPYSNFSIQVKAWTDAGPGNWSEPITARTAAGVPHSPRELKATNTTDTSILVEWKDPLPFVGPILQYTVKWTNEKTELKSRGYTNGTIFIIQDLQPFTNYTIVVQAETNAGPGEWSEPILETTGIGVPTSPRKVKAKNIRDKSILVEWEEPEPYVGPIIRYTVKWLNKNNSLSRSGDSKNSTFLIQDLEPFTNYVISVRAETSAGPGVWSDPENVRTEIGVPLSPREIRASKITDTSLHIEWQDPLTYVGPIVRYHVQWTNENNNRTGSDDTENSSYLIKDLDAFTQYKVSVQAETRAGRGKWSEPVLLRTSVGVPTIPRNIKTTPSNSSIDVRWEQPEPFRGPIQYYTIRWRSPNINNEGVANTTNYVIRNLKPFTSYFIQIKATTSAGGSPWTEAVEVKTLTGIPTAPRNVKEKNVTETSILLEWQDPLPIVGFITRYLITWRNLNNNLIGRAFTEKSPFLIQQLNPFTNYTIMVKAETSAGLGDWSEPLLVRTNIGVPSPPRDVKIENIANTSIAMTWTEPHPKVGDILEYVVIWTDLKSGKKEAGKTISLYYAIESLEPYTNYSIAISAKTEAGVGNSSLPLNVRTKTGVPLAPEKLQNVKINNHSIEIKWEEPKLFKGPIISYTVRWGQSSMAETKNSQYLIPELRPYTWYNISVRARTEAGYGSWSDTIDLQTDIGIPSIPRNLEIFAKRAYYVALTWFEPEFPNGPLLGYRLNWEAPGTPLSSVETNDTSHQFLDLLPYTEYQFRVAANTKAGWGSPSSWLMTRTDVAVPSKAKILSVVVENSSNIITEWETEVPYPGPTNYTLIVWRSPKICDKILSERIERVLEGNKSREDWQHRSVHVVDHLPPYTPFFVQVVLKTEAGESKSGESSIKWTPPKAPGPPSDVTADCKKKSTEVEVHWSVPKNPNGKLTQYLVEFGTEFLGYRETSVKIKDECIEHSVRLKGLRPEREYRIHVRARAEGVPDDGERASLKESCVLPAGVPPLGNTQHVTVEGSGPHHLVIKWNDVVFSDAMGSLIEYSVIVGLPGAVGKAESGDFPDAIPSWLNFSSGMSDVYQATPPDWNPLDKYEDSKDPLNCRILLDISRHKTLQCILGLDSSCSKNANISFCNGPLTPDTKYGVKLRAYTRGGYSETAPVFASTAPIPGSGIVGGLVASFFTLLLIGIIVFGVFFVKKRGGMPYIHKIMASHLPHMKEPSEHPPQPGPQVELETYEQDRCINILNFSDHVRLMMSDSHLRFSEEFDTLKLNSPKYHCASAEMDENRQKNRWMNIFPYDHSRVKLLPLGDEPASDFINANYIPGDSSLREYIASQGPLPHTIDDFWRLIWEQSSTMIVMLTQCVERGKVKCEQYWPPPGEARHYGDIQVRSLSESMLSSYTIRLFHVQLGSHDRRVKQLHFTHWPDFGCPESPEDLINFVRAVRDHLPQIRPGPILVHCSAGVGRTGTFIAVDRLMQQLKHSTFIDIYSTVLELRHHRINMVQTEDQYIYIHLCVKQLVWELTHPSEKEREEAIYSNLAIETETGL